MAGHDAFDIGVTFAILEHTLDIVVSARYYWVHQLHFSRHQSSVTFKKGVRSSGENGSHFETFDLGLGGERHLTRFFPSNVGCIHIQTIERCY